ncbi:MAG: glycosyltransferase, partial [Myxococcota bacterium]
RLEAYLLSLPFSWELILVDDGSPDDTAAAASALATASSHVTVLTMAHNAGQSRAVAAGLSAARGDVVVAMDSDLDTGLEVIEASRC